MNLRDIIELGPQDRIFTIGVFNKAKPLVDAFNDEFDIKLPERALEGIVEGMIEFLLQNEAMWSVTKKGIIRFNKAIPGEYTGAMRELGRNFLSSTLMDHRDEWKIIFRTVERQLGKKELGLMFPSSEEDPDGEQITHGEESIYVKSMTRDERRRYIALELLVDLYKDKSIRKQVSDVLKKVRGPEFFDQRETDLENKLQAHRDSRHEYR